MFRFLSLKKNIDSLIAAAAGACIILLFTRHSGIGLCPDGMVYTTAAENLRAHSKLIDYTHNAVVEFPAFYPFFLSVLIFITGLKPLAFAPVLNATLFALIIYVAGCMMERFSHPSKWYKIFTLSCIVLSPGLLEVYSMVWSETLFILWVLLFIILIHGYFQSYARKFLIGAAVIASFAAITRYAGITLIGLGAVLLVLDSQLTAQKKIRDVLLFCAISPLLLIINLIRNSAFGGTMTGHREKSLAGLDKNLHDTGSVFYDWLPFFNTTYNWAALAAIIIICSLALICLGRFLAKKRLTSYENIAAAFALVYIVFMVGIATISRFETLNSRFMSPSYIPLLWAFSSGLVSVSYKSRYIHKNWIAGAGIAIFLCFQYGQLTDDLETWDGVKDAGIPGYTENQWRYSETVTFIQKDSLPFQKGFTIYSNAYDAVYFFTGRPGKFLPANEYTQGVQNFLKDPHCYIVWFDDGDNPDLLSLDFVIRTKKMRLVKQFNDGAIYEYDTDHS